MDKAAIFGTVASLCSIASFAPQAWKVAKTGDTHALSTKMYVLTVTGFVFWLSYGLVLMQWPIIVTNGSCLVLSAYILFKKLRSPQDAPEVDAQASSGA